VTAGRPRRWKGASLEERELAKFLDVLLKERGLTGEDLPVLLRDRYEDPSGLPARATVQRRLSGDGLAAEQSWEFVSAVIDICCPDNADYRERLHERANMLIRKHREAPTPLEDILSALQEKVALVTKEVSGLRSQLPAEKARLIAERVASLRAANDHAQADMLLHQIAKDEEITAATMVALIGELRNIASVDSLTLSGQIGKHRYYERLPELILGLNNAGYSEEWRHLLQAAGSHVDCLSIMTSLPTATYGGAKYNLIEGTAIFGSLWNPLLDSDKVITSDHYVRITAKSRPSDLLAELLEDISEKSSSSSLRERWVGWRAKLLWEIAVKRPINLLVELLDVLVREEDSTTLPAVLDFLGRFKNCEDLPRALAEIQEAGFDWCAERIIRVAARRPDSADVIAALRLADRGIDLNRMLFAIAETRHALAISWVVRQLRARALNQDADALLALLTRRQRWHRVFIQLILPLQKAAPDDKIWRSTMDCIRSLEKYENRMTDYRVVSDNWGGIIMG
jgi:hypothetical protein